MKSAHPLHKGVVHAIRYVVDLKDKTSLLLSGAADMYQIQIQWQSLSKLQLKVFLEAWIILDSSLLVLGMVTLLNMIYKLLRRK